MLLHSTYFLCIGPRVEPVQSFKLLTSLLTCLYTKSSFHVFLGQEPGVKWSMGSRGRGSATLEGTTYRILLPTPRDLVQLLYRQSVCVRAPPWWLAWRPCIVPDEIPAGLTRRGRGERSHVGRRNGHGAWLLKKLPGAAAGLTGQPARVGAGLLLPCARCAYGPVPSRGSCAGCWPAAMGPWFLFRPLGPSTG